MMRKSKRVSMKDVALKASVSKATVSKVLNNHPDVSEEMARLVKKTCKELGYTVDSTLQSFILKNRTGKTGSITYVLFNASYTDPVYNSFLEGLCKAEKEFNFQLNLIKLSDDIKDIYSLPPILRDHKTDGIILTGDILDNQCVSLIKELKIPTLILGSYQDSIVGELPCVSDDSAYNMNQLVSIFIERGLRRIVFYKHEAKYHFFDKCVKEFREAIINNGLEFSDRQVLKGTTTKFEDETELKGLFLQQDLPFDAVICLDFTSAMQMSHLILTHSGLIRKPKVLLGTTRIHRSMTLPTPAIYIENNFDEIAYEGVRILMDSINGKDNNRIHVMVKNRINTSLS